jgi:hypothetical protein
MQVSNEWDALGALIRGRPAWQQQQQSITRLILRGNGLPDPAW